MRDEVTVLELKLDVRLHIVVFASTMLLLIDEYRWLVPASMFGSSLRGHAVGSLIYYLVIPVVFVVFVFRDSLRDYGFQLRDWRAGDWSARVGDTGQEPPEIAEKVFTAITDDQFYILTHETQDANLRLRFQNILERRNPEVPDLPVRG
jgi:hypothetical protein